MDDIYISFYLRVNRIHIFVDLLRGIDSPKRICFCIDHTGKKLLITPYLDNDFKSHKVPDRVYAGSGNFEVCSMKLCKSLSHINGWKPDGSYRVPGRISKMQNIAVFDLSKATLIER